MPRLSVIMPAYNAARTIVSAATSSLRHLPADAELVVLDDASSDDTVDALEKIAEKDTRLVIFKESQNVGAARALQKLLGRTDSEFVARMDADDFVLPNRFRHQMSHIGNGPDFTFMTVVHYRPGSGSLIRVLRPTLPMPISSEAMKFHLLLNNPVAHSTMMARRSAIEDLGGYRTVPSEDYDLWLRAAGSGYRLTRLAMPGIAYRHHANQITADIDWIRAASMSELTQKAHESLAEQVIGAPSKAFTFLRGVHSQDGLNELEELKLGVIKNSSKLPPSQRFALRLALQRTSTQPNSANKS